MKFFWRFIALAMGREKTEILEIIGYQIV